MVKRLRIERNSHIAYEEAFHSGVNIIRGENSSGKSTILNFLFYGLGGDLTAWSEAALLCTHVNVEVLLNGKIATLSREISKEPGRSMDIFGGPLESALEAPRSEWTRYPYKRSPSRESFSQAIFRLLQMPEASNEASGNVTIHQMLRLLYADQLSPVEHIFRFERFDTPLIRDAVGRLVCGAYDNHMYQNELRIRALSKEFDSVSGELRSLLSVLGKAEESLTLDWIAGQRKVLLERKAALRTEIEQAERRMFGAAEKDKLSLRAQDQAYTAVQKLQARVGELAERHDAILLTISDSNAFIAGLEQKLTALNDASIVADCIGDIEFQSCPACFAPVKRTTEKVACYLCKTPFDAERMRERIVSMINDTALQLSQSRTLQTRRELELNTLTKELSEARESWTIAASHLQQARQLPSTEVQQELRELHQRFGYLEREIEDLENKANIVQLVDQLSSRKSDLNAEITRLRTENETREADQKRRISIAYTAIADGVRDLLHKDLKRQDSFEKAQNIQFDFAANSVTVDNVAYFSASSRALLKTGFFVAMLAAALKYDFFRHPRFVLIDTIEDKGMEAIRSQNFQRLIVDLSQASKIDHQIIFATAMIAPELDTPEFTVGKYSTHDSPTLDIG